MPASPPTSWPRGISVRTRGCRRSSSRRRRPEPGWPWRTPTQPLPQEGNPRAVFQKLFGQGDTDKERAAILHETGSILDRVKSQATRLQTSLGVRDRIVVTDYLDSVARDRASRADGGEGGHDDAEHS